MTRRKSITVKVEPQVLDWAIRSSGWTVDEVVKKLKMSMTVVNSWLKGELSPTLKQLELLSTTLKRPLAAFFLPSPPAEKPLPKDYRMIPEREGEFDKKTILAIRRARRLQNVSKELSDNLNASTNSLLQKATVSTYAPELAEKYRQEFGFTEDKQKKLKTPYEVFYFLRDIIEDKNILTFQISMPVEDARGLTLVDETPATIVINSKDAIEARIFTLMHEFGHVLLQESGISMPENVLLIKNVERVEKWCNDFASAFLLPESLANFLFAQNKEVLTETKTLNKFSRSYKLSKAMLLYNMAKLEFIPQKQYEAVLERYKPKKEELKGRKERGFRASADKKCMSEKGQKFVSLVLSNVERGFITRSDALSYLSIKSKNLEKVSNKAKK